MRINIPFVRQHGERTARTLSSEKLINWSAQQVETHGKTLFALIQRPGLDLTTTINFGPHRGALEHDGAMYVVSGNRVYQFAADETVTFLGNTATSLGRVDMATNGTELIIVDGQDGWIYNSTAMTFAQITDVDFVDAQQVVFINGRFVVNRPGTGEFYISGVYDGTSWQSLDFATAEIDPDDLLALGVSHEELVLFGEFSTQFYHDTGNALFPFETQPGGSIEWGIAAPWSVAKGDNTIVWLAKTRAGQANVVKATGFSPTVISSPALEEAMAGYETIADAYAYVIKPNVRSLFYVLTFPTSNVTWVYDFATNLWHQWSSHGVGRFIGATHCYFNNRHYIGSSIDGKLYHLNDERYSDDTEPLERVAATSHIAEDQNRIFWHSLEILFDAGKGLSTGQGSDPQAMLRWSDDGGYTYSNSLWRSMGKIGEYGRRAIWRRLGQSRHRVYELRVTDPVPVTVIGAFAEISKGNN